MLQLPSQPPTSRPAPPSSHPPPHPTTHALQTPRPSPPPTHRRSRHVPHGASEPAPGSYRRRRRSDSGPATRGSVTKVVAHRSPLSPTKVCNDFRHRPSTAGYPIYRAAPSVPIRSGVSKSAREAAISAGARGGVSFAFGVVAVVSERFARSVPLTVRSVGDFARAAWASGSIRRRLGCPVWAMALGEHLRWRG